jgi:16S rRNA (guanine527-N7)-methyltransferase
VSDPDRASTRHASAPDSISGPEEGSSGLPAGVPPEVRPAAEAFFGERLALAERYVEMLVTAGVERGLMGPREAPRIWDRHLLNCVAISELIPSGVYVVDVGSGAGLPGIVLAVARPDIRVSLVESLARRTTFLTEAVDMLGLDTVDVVRARAEDCVNVLEPADVVTARAVAPLDRLVGWCLPLARPGGSVLAIKGSSAAAEIEEHRTAVRRLGGGPPTLLHCGERWLAEPVTVVEVRRVGAAGPVVSPRKTANAREGRGARRGRDRRSTGSGNDSARAAGTARSGDGGDHPEN